MREKTSLLSRLISRVRDLINPDDEVIYPEDVSTPKEQADHLIDLIIASQLRAGEFKQEGDTKREKQSRGLARNLKVKLNLLYQANRDAFSTSPLDLLHKKHLEMLELKNNTQNILNEVGQMSAKGPDNKKEQDNNKKKRAKGRATDLKNSYNDVAYAFDKNNTNSQNDRDIEIQVVEDDEEEHSLTKSKKFTEHVQNHPHIDELPAGDDNTPVFAVPKKSPFTGLISGAKEARKKVKQFFTHKHEGSQLESLIIKEPIAPVENLEQEPTEEELKLARAKKRQEQEKKYPKLTQRSKDLISNPSKGIPNLASQIVIKGKKADDLSENDFFQIPDEEPISEEIQTQADELFKEHDKIIRDDEALKKDQEAQKQRISNLLSRPSNTSSNNNTNTPRFENKPTIAQMPTASEQLESEKHQTLKKELKSGHGYEVKGQIATDTKAIDHVEYHFKTDSNDEKRKENLIEFVYRAVNSVKDAHDKQSYIPRFSNGITFNGTQRTVKDALIILYATQPNYKGNINIEVTDGGKANFVFSFAEQKATKDGKLNTLGLSWDAITQQAKKDHTFITNVTTQIHGSEIFANPEDELIDEYNKKSASRFSAAL